MKGLILHPSHNEFGEPRLRHSGRQRSVDLRRLELMEDWDIENVLAKAKTFSEALKVLGVGRKTFMRWLDLAPERKTWMGRRRAVPIWEDGKDGG